MMSVKPLSDSSEPPASPIIQPPIHGSGPEAQVILFQVGEQSITAADILSRLRRYRLLPQFLREVILDQAIAPFTSTNEDLLAATRQFYEQQQIKSDRDLETWLTLNSWTQEQLGESLKRVIQLEKFKRATWENKLESYFLQRKGQLDRVIYSLIRLKDEHLAQELYFRIQEGEQTLAELARQYSEGPEAQTGGLLGPVELSKPHPLMAQALATNQPGQLLPPIRLEGWVVLLRLEQFLPCQLDEVMRQRLLNELFETWIAEQIREITL